MVIGTSAGGVPALRALAASLPPDFPAAVGVVLHLAPDSPSLLPGLLDRAGPLPAREVHGRHELRAGHLYLPPPDHHLYIDGDHVEATKGPRENRHRPSVDVLFRSTAYTRGADVIGVVLTGLLSDGTSGLWTVKRRGGVAVVQDPRDAEYDSMPASALAHVEVDHVVPLAGLAALLVRLVTEAPPPGEPHGDHGEDTAMSEEEERRLALEANISRDEQAYQRGVLGLGTPSSLTCPECHGSLVEIREGRLLRYRCHTGHAFSADSLLSDMTKTSEREAYQLLRALEEAEILLRRLARHYDELGDDRSAGLFLERVDELEERSRRARDLALGNRRFSETGILRGEGEERPNTEED